MIHTPDQNRLYLIKHALPSIDPGIPAREWRLSPAGRTGAQRLAEDLASAGIARIYTSTEPKAIETGEILAERLGAPCAAVEGLHEHERSQVGYLDREQFEQQVAALFAHPDQVVFGDESADQAYARFARALDGLIQSQIGPGPLAVVAHGTVISLLAERRCGLDGFGLWKRMGLPSYILMSWPGWEVLGRQPWQELT